MKHLLKPLFLVLTLLCVSIGISAQEANPDDLYQVSNEGKTLTITPGTDLADVMTSLGEQNQDVTELYITGNYPNRASLDNLKSSYFPNLEKVHLTLETTETSINGDLNNRNIGYWDCKLLSSIEIPSYVTSIEHYAFYGCSSLTSVGDLSACLSIENYAFYGCSSLTSVGDLSACQSIGGSAFSGCSSLTSIGDLSACQSIGNSAFYNCSSLTSVDLSACQSIENYAFSGCSSLTSVDLPACQSIGYSAFSGCSSLTSIGDLSACQSIGGYAFDGCSSLTSVGDLPVCQSIGGYAFYKCSSLTSIGDLPVCQSIGEYAFYNCPSLVSIDLSSCTSIGKWAFYQCSSLTSVDLSACQSIGEYAFANDNDNSSLEYVGDMSACKVLPQGVFWRCKKLTSIGDLSACENIGDRAFQSCSSLTSIGDLSACQSIGSDPGLSVKIVLNPENLNKWITNDYVSNYFRDHEKQVKGTDTEGYDLVLKEDITAIPDYALQNCQGLRSVTATAALSSIGVNAFANCKDLIAVTCNDVKSIGENAFPAMTYNPCKITINANEPATLAAVNCFNNVCLIYVPATTLDAYHAAQYWQSHASQIIAIGCQEDYDVNVAADSNMSSLHVAIGENNLSNVTSLKVTGTINSYDLMLMRNKMTNLRSLDLTDARIVSNPYEYYQGFSSVTDVLTRHSMPDNIFTLALPASIKQINSYALSDFTNLRELQIPASVEIMEANVANGNAVTDIYFTEGSQLTSLGGNAFQNCKGIVNPKLEYTSIPTIGNNTFDGCNNMVSISIPASVNTVKENAFYRCSSLKTLNIMDSEEEIRIERSTYTSWGTTYTQTAFNDCGKLTSLYLGRNVKGVNNNPFSGRSSLKNVEIGSKVTALADNLFQNCSGIEELTGDMSNIESIGHSAFSGCYNLQEFAFNDKIKSISDYAFYRCSALKSIDIPVNITSLGLHTFDGCTAATECVIPANSQISTIPTYCFANCTSLKKVNLPVSVKEIEDYAFYNCTGMEEAKISSAVNHVGDYAFNGCTKLFDVYTYTIEPQAINQNTFSQFSGATLHVPTVSWYNYYYDTQWSQFLKMVNFDEPYDYVFVEKDFTLRTDQVGTIKGNPQFDIWGGGAFIIAGNLLQMAKDCYLGFKNGKWGSIIPSCGNFKPQTLYVNIDVDKDFWYAFSFPFDVDLTKVKTSSCGDYVFRRYDGAMRAENGSGGWQSVTGNTLKANTGYIFRTNVAGTLSIPITAPQFSTIDKIIDILTHPSSIGAEHAGWNFIGNPFTAYYSMNDMNYEAPVMVWNGTTYEAYRPGDDDHVFHPFEAFFVQRPSNKSCVSFKMNNRMSCNESEAMLASNAKKASSTFATTANAKRKLINLTLSDGTMTDKCRVVYNDEQFMGYDADCDAAKFVSSENVPQIYTIDDNGTKYAINERPMQDSKVMLGYVANADGEYTIAAPRMDAKVVIFDREENVLHDFADGDYTFETAAGTNNTRFAIYSSNMVPTDVKEIAGVAADAESDGDAYDLGGRKVVKSAKGVIIKSGMKQVVK